MAVLVSIHEGYCHPNDTIGQFFDNYVQKLAIAYIRELTAFFPVTYDAQSFNAEEGDSMSFSILPKELKARIDKGDKLVLLDVREPWENSLAKLDGSILIPLGTLPQSLSKLDKNTEIIAYCHHGMRSADATGFLLQQGFPNVKNLVGGIDAWSIQVDGTVPRY